MKKRHEFFLGFCMQPAPATTDVYVRTPEDCYKTCEEQAGYGSMEPATLVVDGNGLSVLESTLERASHWRTRTQGSAGRVEV